MRAFVFTDKALARHAGRFVWLEIDTEKAQNAAFRKQYPASALPTFVVLDPDSERVRVRWVGGASVQQLDKLLASAASGGKPAKRAAPADVALERADRLYGASDWKAAAAAYGEALAAAPRDWQPYARAVESRLFALSSSDDDAACAILALDAFPRLARMASAANVAASGLDCALALPDSHPQRAALASALEAHARAVAADLELPIAADDRSGLYITLHDAREAAHDTAGARDVAQRWSAFLDAEAARARKPEERTVFDSHRLSAYMELGQPERAVPMLEASERDFPDDYNPPARLAIAYKAMKNWDAALAANTRALDRVYGPRKLVVLQTRAEIFTGRGDAASARQTLQGALEFAEALPPGQRSEGTIKSIRRKLDALPQP